jgi:CheY-like chemotaxis protein
MAPSNPRVLIVTDRGEDRALWSGWLTVSDQAMELVVPETKADLRTLLQDSGAQFAVIVLDYNFEHWELPDEFPRDGREVMEKLRPNPKRDRLPYVIMLTIFDDERIRHLERTYGAVYKDSRYITADLLRDAVEHFLSRL